MDYGSTIFNRPTVPMPRFLRGGKSAARTPSPDPLAPPETGVLKHGSSTEISPAAFARRMRSSAAERSTLHAAITASTLHP